MAPDAHSTGAPSRAPSSPSAKIIMEQLSSLLEQIEGVNRCALEAIGPGFTIEAQGQAAMFATDTLLGLARQRIEMLQAA